MTVCCIVAPFSGTLRNSNVGFISEDIKWTDQVQHGTTQIITIPFFNAYPQQGGGIMDPKDIKAFKEASPEERLIVIMNGAQGNRSLEYLAIWLAELERKMKA